MENWQAFVPSSEDPAEQSGAPPGVPTGAEERVRTLSLIDFLADYHARRNPPVYDIKKYGLFLLRDVDLPEVPGLSLTPAAEAWLTVDFRDLPPRPEVPTALVPLLGDSAAISPHTRPGTDVAERAGEPEPDPDLVVAAERWTTEVWEPFAAEWVAVSQAKTLHRNLFQQRPNLRPRRQATVRPRFHPHCAGLRSTAPRHPARTWVEPRPGSGRGLPIGPELSAQARPQRAWRAPSGCRTRAFLAKPE